MIAVDISWLLRASVPLLILVIDISELVGPNLEGCDKAFWKIRTLISLVGGYNLR